MKQAQRQLNGNTSFAEERKLMLQIVDDTRWLRDHLATRLEMFNTPVQTDGTGERYFNPECFLRSDSEEHPGVFLFQPIGGNKQYGVGSQHKVVSDLWSKLVGYCREVHNNAYAIYHNFFDGQNNLGLTDVHYKMLGQDLVKLKKAVDSGVKQYFNELEAFIKRIPCATGYGPYYIGSVKHPQGHGFEKPVIDQKLTEIRNNIDHLVYAMEPYFEASKANKKLQTKLQQNVQPENASAGVQTPQFMLNSTPGAMPLKQAGKGINTQSLAKRCMQLILDIYPEYMDINDYHNEYMENAANAVYKLINSEFKATYGDNYIPVGVSFMLDLAGAQGMTTPVMVYGDNVSPELNLYIDYNLSIRIMSTGGYKRADAAREFESVLAHELVHISQIMYRPRSGANMSIWRGYDGLRNFSDNYANRPFENQAYAESVVADIKPKLTPDMLDNPEALYELIMSSIYAKFHNNYASPKAKQRFYSTVYNRIIEELTGEKNLPLKQAGMDPRNLQNITNTSLNDMYYGAEDMCLRRMGRQSPGLHENDVKVGSLYTHMGWEYIKNIAYYGTDPNKAVLHMSLAPQSQADGSTKLEILDFVIDKTKGLLVGKALSAVMQRLRQLGVDENSISEYTTISVDSEAFMRSLLKRLDTGKLSTEPDMPLMNRPNTTAYQQSDAS